MQQSVVHSAEATPISRAQIPPFAGTRALGGLNRQLVITSAISAALVVTLTIADWMIWRQASLNPLLVLATLLLMGAVVAGVWGLQRWSLMGDAAPSSVARKSVSVSVQSLLFELGLLLTLSWIVDLTLKAFKK